MGKARQSPASKAIAKARSMVHEAKAQIRVGRGLRAALRAEEKAHDLSVQALEQRCSVLANTSRINRKAFTDKCDEVQNLKEAVRFYRAQGTALQDKAANSAEQAASWYGRYTDRKKQHLKAEYKLRLAKRMFWLTWAMYAVDSFLWVNTGNSIGGHLWSWVTSLL